MKKFNVKFARDFEVGIEAMSLDIAEHLAKQIVAQFPKDTARVLSIQEMPEGAELIELADEVRGERVQQELARPRYPNGIDDLPVGA